jgi:CubicO group peptidase (beta-lactamase class C family)
MNPEKVGFSAERLARIQPVMQSHLEKEYAPGFLTLVERKGEIVHLEKCGFQDIATQKPLDFNHIFRIYSMTKPVMSAAFMTLVEQAKCHLFDPVHKFLPEFESVKVLEPGGTLVTPKTPIMIHHLLTHTAGLTYGVFGESEVDKLYQKADLFNLEIKLDEMVKRIASLPLLYHPGERWAYSVATDVVGRLAEVISGLDLETFLQQTIFQPLGMTDTTFSLPPEKVGRLTTCYAQTETDRLVVADPAEGSEFIDVVGYSGGGGLVSTLGDYLRFARMVLNQGELEGVRILGRKTMERMGSNHLPDALLPMVITEPNPGYGFGLGFSVLMEVPQTGGLGTVGTLGWGGMASTVFWVDPLEELIGILMTQNILMEPVSFESDFRNLVYQALVD